jgi:L-asparaginase
LARQIVVFATGGTIAGAAADASDHVGYKAGELAIAQLLAGIPGLEGQRFRSEQVAQVDSKDMAFGVWRELAWHCSGALAHEDVQGVVVTHGTDTLEETAWFLQRVLAPRKPVVLASAMRPATAASADGPQNLLDAFSVARHPGAAGVVSVSAGEVHGAADVRKVHPYRIDAFSSGEAGPVALVQAGAVRELRPWPQGQADAALLARVVETEDWPWVEIVASGAGTDGRAVDALAAAGVQGLVVAGTGNGTVHQDLEAALARAQANGVDVVRSTRCIDGSIVPGAPSPFPASALTPAKARVDLLLDLLGRGPA